MKRSLFTAIAATLLFASTIGGLVAVAMFGVIRIGEQMLQAVGVLPMRWGEENISLMMMLAGIATLPLIVWFTWWLFRRSLKAEQEMADYKYDPSSFGTSLRKTNGSTLPTDEL